MVKPIIEKVWKKSRRNNTKRVDVCFSRASVLLHFAASLYLFTELVVWRRSSYYCKHMVDVLSQTFTQLWSIHVRSSFNLYSVPTYFEIKFLRTAQRRSESILMDHHMQLYNRSLKPPLNAYDGVSSRVWILTFGRGLRINVRINITYASSSTQMR